MCVCNNFARNAKSDSHLCVKIFCAPALFASFTIANEYQMSFVSASECVCILTWISTVWHRISIHSSRLGNNLCMFVECSVRWAALGKFRVSCSFTHTHTYNSLNKHVHCYSDNCAKMFAFARRTKLFHYCIYLEFGLSKF